jgi:uncharacterized protein (DUF1800 family)
MAVRTRALLALNRFGMGARPGDADIVAADPVAWILKSADGRGVSAITGVPSGTERMAHIEALNKERREIREADALARKSLPPGTDPPPPARPVLRDEGMLMGDDLRAMLVAVCLSNEPVKDRLASFWSNQLTVSSMRGEVAALVVPYENEAVRPMLGGLFSDMLMASFVHPAMMLYLDAAQSFGPDSPAGKRAHRSYNENYAREVMELHTMGASGGYAQEDIVELALALSGWTLERETGLVVFRADRHEPGERHLLGTAIPDAGSAQAGMALGLISSHPSTSARLCRRLASHFVADVPPQSLVSAMDHAWRASGGNLSVVYRALFSSPLAWNPSPGKFRSPWDFVVASARALGTGGDDAGAQAMLKHVRALGQPPFAAPSPQGYGDLEADWLTPDSIVQRINVAAAMASAAAPSGIDALHLSSDIIDVSPASHTHDEIAMAPSPIEALALVLASPEFQRR